MGQVLAPLSGSNRESPAVTGITRSAANRVLETPELLEMILVQTDMRTLLISAQRVCRTWKALIDHSPSLQRALFFTPVKDPSKWTLSQSSSSTPTLQTSDVKRAVLNPLLMEAFPPIFAGTGPGNHEFDFTGLPTLPMLMRMDASWRRMLVSQPPIADIGVFHAYHIRGGSRAWCFCIGTQSRRETTEGPSEDSCSSPECLTMERLLDVLVLSSNVRFGLYTRPSIRWAVKNEDAIAEDTILQYGTQGKSLHAALKRFGVVIHLDTTPPRRMSRLAKPVSEAEHTRRAVFYAYKEVESEIGIMKRRRHIDQSTVEMGYLVRNQSDD